MKLIGRRLKSRWATLIIFLSIIGPGIITANVDNDAGGITTYSLAGGNYGRTVLWIMIPLAIALYVMQEMCARMGAVTGKGLADLIRENFGLKITFWLMVGVVFTNLTNTMAEFAGVASSCEIFGLSKYLTVPAAGLLVWFIVVKGSYRTVEKVFLAACTVYLSYVVSGFMARPHWGEVLHSVLVPQFTPSADYITMIIGMVGTTIAPWMQFYVQASVVDKGVRASDYRLCRLDVLTGSIVAIAVVFFIVVTCAATINTAGIHVDEVKDAAMALRPLAGDFCATLFAIGLLNASLFAASILPLATAYQVAEGVGWERGVNRSFREAPEFYTLYTALIVLGAGIVLIPNAPLLKIMYLSQVLNGILLPVVIIFMLILVNKKSLMGEFRNSLGFNVISYVTAAVVIGLTVMLALTTLFPNIFAHAAG
jgi:NRAMP (natural resistance-associated macrophage protein)-like metal ion transporter